MIASALVFQILLVVYHQTTTWFDFFPFNGIRFYAPRERMAEAAVNLFLMSLPPIGFLFHVSALMKFGVTYYFVLFAIECATWWAPYFFGASAKWAAMHDRMHAQTISILPKRENHPGPNLEHLILMVLTLFAVCTTLSLYRINGDPSFRIWLSAACVSAVLGGVTFYQFVLAGRFASKTSG